MSHARLVSAAVLCRCGDADRVCAGADEEAFEDNSEEYIRRDLEGSGKDFSFAAVSHVVEGRPLVSDIGHHFPLSPVLPQTSTPVEGRRATW